jgi:thiosulfate/3-mercaptopyruvate sulfurtransferase
VAGVFSFLRPDHPLSEETPVTTTTRTIDTAELRDRLDDPSLTIVDVRPLAAYNGWRLGAETRGGHIPGAVAFPVAWLDTVDEPEIARLFAGKGITADREIAVYGTSAAEASRLAERLVSFGVEGARVYEPGFAAWAADTSLRVDRLPKYEKLVHIDWL